MQASSATRSATTLGDLVYALLRTVQMSPEDDRFKAIEEHDLSVTQLRATATLSCAAEQLPGGAIAERVGATPGAVSRALDDLVRKGLVTRRESEDDRRVRLFSVTPAGAELAAQLFALKRAQVDRFLDRLDEADRERLEAALVPLAAGGHLNPPTTKEAS
jgi:MarR family 2-MHQ and catechol resistance regulon transcriptional repressor